MLWDWFPFNSCLSCHSSHVVKAGILTFFFIWFKEDLGLFTIWIAIEQIDPVCLLSDVFERKDSAKSYRLWSVWLGYNFSIELTVWCLMKCFMVLCTFSVFDDGDERTLRRSSLCLKGERHFAESEVWLWPAWTGALSLVFCVSSCLVISSQTFSRVVLFRLILGYIFLHYIVVVWRCCRQLYYIYVLFCFVFIFWTRYFKNPFRNKLKYFLFSTMTQLFVL